MLTLNDVKREFGELKRTLKSLTNKIEYDLDNVERYEDLDQAFLRNQYYGLREKAEKILNDLEYLDGEIIDQGTIRHNESGRYGLPSGRYFTSGSCCEIFRQHPDWGEPCWVITSIEHDGDDYYATALGRTVSIDGMLVRVRG